QILLSWLDGRKPGARLNANLARRARRSERQMAEQLSDEDAVLSANLEFYRAFNNRDSKAMDALWAKTAPVLCVHPGWTALVGRDVVLRSWRDILANGAAPHVMCHDDRAFIYGDLAIVQCEEELDTG